MKSRDITNLTSFIKGSVLFYTLLMILAPSGMAGCGVNFDKMRKRRIEAIRGQILSKLGMTQLPTSEPPPGPVPREIEDMYNRTRDFVLEQARQKREECDDPEENYYAQDILTVYANTNQQSRPAGTQSRSYKVIKSKRQLSEFFQFDLEKLNLDPDSVVSASLRLYQVHMPGRPRRGQQQVELYQLSPGEMSGSPPNKRFVTMRFLDTYGEGWRSFDVTSAVNEWLRIPSLNDGFELTIPCAEDEVPRLNSPAESKKLDIVFAGSEASKRQDVARGDHRDDDNPALNYPVEYNPQLVIMVRIPHSQSKSQSGSQRRRKRSLDEDYCFRRNPSETNCCLRELFINFRRDLGWTWIHAPSGYKANFCAGACPYLWSMDTQHATILSLYKTMNPRASSAPCCTPKELEPLTIMYYDKGKYRFTQMNDMILISCKCS